MILEKLLRRLTLREWAKMDDWRKSIKDAILNGETDKAADLIHKSSFLPLPKFIPYRIALWMAERCFWMNVVSLFTAGLERNVPTKRFPILTVKSDGKPEAWEYEGRGWYFWLNIFAEAYGWTAEKVSRLDLDDAIALYQEIVASDHARREWEYGLSEVAYEYMASTKQSRYKPLQKPSWMMPTAETATRKTTQPKIKILKSMMPLGNVVDLDKRNIDNETIIEG